MTFISCLTFPGLVRSYHNLAKNTPLTNIILWTYYFPCASVSMIVKMEISSMGFGLNDDLVFISFWSASIHQQCDDTLTPKWRMQSHKEPEHKGMTRICSKLSTAEKKNLAENSKQANILCFFYVWIIKMFS